MIITIRTRPTAAPRRPSELTYVLSDETLCPPAYTMHGTDAAATFDHLAAAITAELALLIDANLWDGIVVAVVAESWLQWQEPARALLQGIVGVAAYGASTWHQGSWVRLLRTRRCSYLKFQSALAREAASRR